MSMQQFTLKTEKIEEIRGFLERFKKISQTLLLEIKSDSIVAKTYTPDKGFIKKSEMDIDHIGSFDNAPGMTIKVPFFNIDRVMKNIDLLPKGEISIVFHCEKAKESYLASKVHFIGDSLSIINACTEMDYVVSLGDQVYENIIKSAEKGIQFTLHKLQIKKITSLFDIDSAEKTVSIRLDKETERLHIFNDLYDYQIPEEIEGDLSNVLKIKKEYLSYLGDDTFKINLSEDKMIAHSTESNTTSIIGVVYED